MREFDLVSIDWDTVRLMQAGQFKQETWYLEELTRWSLQRGRIAGLLHLTDDGVSRPSPEGERMFSLSVRGCVAVTPQGHIIEIPDDRQLAVSSVIEARTTVVPLFVGVSLVERAREPQLSPTADTGLLGCGGRRRLYRIASDDSDSSFDWFQIAQFEKTPSGLMADPNFFPESLFLSSHGGQWRAQQEIGRLATQCLEILAKQSSASVPRFAAACALAGSLGPAARVVDERLAPRAYVDRLAGVFAAQCAQLLALPAPGLKLYQETTDALRGMLEYLDGASWTMGQALVLAKDCFERLLKLYPALLQSLEAAAPALERVTLDHDSVVAARPPRGRQEEEPAPGPTQTSRRLHVAQIAETANQTQ